MSTNVTTSALTTPAVIVGANADGLGIARSLGRAGVPVILADSDVRRPGMHSRYACPFVLTAMSGPGLIDGLLALRGTLDARPVLFVTSDLQVRSVSESRERLEKAFRIRLPNHQSVCDLLDKRGFQRVAEGHGFPVPRAITIREEKDINKLAKLRYPAVIKPPNKEYFTTLRALTVTSREQAATVCRSILASVPELIVQEWIGGRESEIYFCLQYRGVDGLTVSSFTGRKLRSWPPQTGSTASCVAAPEMEETLEPLTRAFFDKTGFVGMCSMEFKRDERDGNLFMIEPTVGRTDWQEEVAVINGVNIPLAAYRYELGLPQLGAQSPPVPQIWMYPPSLWRSMLATKSFRDRRPAGARVKSACWCPDDPVPLAFFLREWIRDVWSPARWREFMFARGKLMTSCQSNATGHPTTGAGPSLPATEAPCITPEPRP